MSTIFIGIGSNQGNKTENIAAAYQLLSPAVKIKRISPFYITEPWGYHDQDDFLNGVWEAETQLSPEDLLLYFKRIESRIGRIKNFRNGPRLIDLDILLYDDLLYETPELTIPHSRISERRFVLQPLCALIPDQKNPRTGKTWKELLNQAPDERVSLYRGPINLDTPVIRWGLRTYLMGIINLTPDSFSGDGLIKNSQSNIISETIKIAENHLVHGADILDLGAESTRPGSVPISEKEELNRLIPSLKTIRKEFPHALISVDTQKSAVAEQAINCGADWINDVGAGINDKRTLQCIVGNDHKIVLMRNKPLFSNNNPILSSDKIVERIRSELLQIIDNAQRSGITHEQIILDPGIGFGSTAAIDMEIIRRLKDFYDLGYPILIGPSRKSFIGKYLNQKVEDRLAGTSAAVISGIINHADIIRVHDVEFMYDLIRMTNLFQ